MASRHTDNGTPYSMPNALGTARLLRKYIGGAEATVREATQPGRVFIHVDNPDDFGAIAQVLMERSYHFYVDATYEVPPTIKVTAADDPEERARAAAEEAEAAE